MYRGTTTSRLARVICGVNVANIQTIFGQPNIHEDVWDNDSCKQKDSVVLLLIRYASAHPDSGRHRGPENRPLCPGVLRDTHCLWKWYERPVTFRRGCWRPRPWERHRHLFGSTILQQTDRKRQEARTWYDVISVKNILRHTNVQPDFDRPESFLQSIMWC